MQLVFCSEGSYAPHTVLACDGFCSKLRDAISVVITNEAYAVEKGDKY
jgi:hypothetical protein